MTKKLKLYVSIVENKDPMLIKDDRVNDDVAADQTCGGWVV